MATSPLQLTRRDFLLLLGSGLIMTAAGVFAMPNLSRLSRSRLATCHPDLVVLFNTVTKEFSCKILDGRRGKIVQNYAYENGKSKLKWPNSKHNSRPSMGIDAIPYPVNYADIERFYYFAGFVKGIASRLYREGQMTHKIRWGGDWDGDGDFHDQDFNDLSHYELIEE